tara:strand:+ start:1202 stop:1711 length:510 start_codon:yes stop_codon:yes gene_type:complete
MSDKIINKIANSKLITIDLVDYAPKSNIESLDITDFLSGGVVLKEKEFRLSLKEFDFSIYSGKTIALNCSTEAILPMWAFMLVTSYLNNFASNVRFGTKEEVFEKIFISNVEAIDASEFLNKKVIVKGCGQIPVSESLYIAITLKLQNKVSSLMFGEACSSVPVFKSKK